MNLNISSRTWLPSRRPGSPGGRKGVLVQATADTLTKEYWALRTIYAARYLADETHQQRIAR